MNDNVEHIILEHLRALRNEVTDVKVEMGLMRGEMIAMKQHTAGLLASESTRDYETAAVKVRLDRIERRLNISDEK